MAKNTINNKPKASRSIVGGLIIANVVAFLITALFFSTQKSTDEGEISFMNPEPKLEYVEKGWQVMHWAYSVTELFSDND